ncbi:MAG: MaoC family dehydratase N-terminal domain-containing protein [Pseudomonadales bacterium]|nr:MaoC family dehydratase N-terminal domain-containing protein [Pseudomonadales bacterium]
MDQDIIDLREKYLNQDFDTTPFEIDPKKTVEYARLCGETAPRFLDPADADFQASPTYIASLMGGRTMPKDFPVKGIGMDAGKGVECLAPIRPGQTLNGKTHLHDIYTKTGRSGRMVFVVSRIEFYDNAGKHLANSDSRIVIREKG